MEYFPGIIGIPSFPVFVTDCKHHGAEREDLRSDRVLIHFDAISSQSRNSLSLTTAMKDQLEPLRTRVPLSPKTMPYFSFPFSLCRYGTHIL